MDAKNKKQLIEGRFMNCPRCLIANDILRYIPMQQGTYFVGETNPIYKCPECKWIFGPADHVLETFKYV